MPHSTTQNSDTPAIAQQWQNIQAHNPRLAALITPPSSASLNPQSGPLGGVTVSLKDNIDTAGIPTTAGAAFWKHRVPRHNAYVVERLLAAGATPFGKANMTELAWGVRSYSATGGQCRNPWDEQRIAGGSSGGSAASIAAGLCHASLGTDTGGSVRLPASFCGVTGLRPTHGRISNHGVIPLSESHDTIGPMARSAAEVARLFNAIAGYDHQDPYSQAQAMNAVTTQLEHPLQGITIGIPKNYYFDYCQDEVGAAVMQAATQLESQGAILKAISIPLVEQAQAMAACIMFSEVCALYEERLQQEPESISFDIRSRMEHGFVYNGRDYARAVAFRQRWRQTLRDIYQKVDIMLVPTTTQTAPLIDDGQTLYAITRELARNTYPSSLASIPSLSVPCGFGAGQLPIGMLLEAPWWQEALLLRVAHQYQQRSDFHLQTPAWLD
ncbi:amidase [Alcaligenes endophyticus]|uniref:Amidase n=1 Tax=Alcaligenes endophyticus TaxID=1929088 RepID=A0ABT8EL24_9BURK|nr:amidase [Alcaligenes endophyticus]MCX5590642.1 amidase [Alcaligenes endophyticus]MDN4121994.1 amidase [Alcaligenes endophyticus]